MESLVLFLHSIEEYLAEKLSYHVTFDKMSNKHNLLLLFERKLEPVFMQKGPHNAVFDVPDKLLSDRYKGSVSVTQRFGDEATERIPVKNIPVPDLGGIEKFGRDQNFSLFIPHHRDLAAQLIHIFMGKSQFHFFITTTILSALITLTLFPNRSSKR